MLAHHTHADCFFLFFDLARMFKWATRRCLLSPLALCKNTRAIVTTVRVEFSFIFIRFSHKFAFKFDFNLCLAKVHFNPSLDCKFFSSLSSHTLHFTFNPFFFIFLFLHSPPPFFTFTSTFAFNFPFSLFAWIQNLVLNSLQLSFGPIFCKICVNVVTSIKMWLAAFSLRFEWTINTNNGLMPLFSLPY